MVETRHECTVLCEGLEQLLKESEDDALKRQVRGVLDTIGATTKDTTLLRRRSVPSQPRTAGKVLTYLDLGHPVS